VIDEYLEATLSLLLRLHLQAMKTEERRSNDTYFKLFSSLVSEREHIVGTVPVGLYFVLGCLIVFNMVAPDWLMSSSRHAKSKLCYDRRSAGQSVLEQSTHFGLMTRS
jgi:hypothetical protein